MKKINTENKFVAVAQRVFQINSNRKRKSETKSSNIFKKQ